MSDSDIQIKKNNEKMWLLIEWETTTGPNTYTVVNAFDIVGAPHSDLYTGKSVFVRRGGNKAMQATIVTISKDKQFLDTELKQLKRMSDENLNKSEYLLEEEKGKKQNRKRRRTIQPLSKSEEIIKPSISSTSLNYSRGNSPTWLPQSSSNSDANSNCGSTTTTAVYSCHVPPMTFDQQTQTDNKNATSGTYSNEQMEKIVSVQQSILEENKSIRAESSITRKVLNDLSEQIAVLTNMYAEFKSKIIESKTIACNNNTINSNNNVQKPIILNGTKSNLSMNNIQSDESVIIFETNEENKDDLRLDNSQILNSTNCYENNDNNLTISFNGNSRYSFNDSSIESQNKDSKSNIVLENSKIDWSEIFNDENEKSDIVHIGMNKTVIPLHIMRSIKWSSHTAATRKLLMSVFPRDILATHSLTGKPSPAFQDRAKPPKMMLDHKKISDIIQTVTKYSRVPESVVRNAITTKCADENKMFRQRASKTNNNNNSNNRNDELKQLKVTNDNKENIPL